LQKWAADEKLKANKVENFHCVTEGELNRLIAGKRERTMTLTLDLPAADEAALREIAAAPPDARAAALQAAARVLRTHRAANGANGHTTGGNEANGSGHHAPEHDGKVECIARQLAALEEFEARTREYSADAPPLSDYAVSRAAIYEGRGA
jgi:hypothetical protein